MLIGKLRQKIAANSLPVWICEFQASLDYWVKPEEGREGGRTEGGIFTSFLVLMNYTAIHMHVQLYDTISYSLLAMCTGMVFYFWL